MVVSIEKMHTNNIQTKQILYIVICMCYTEMSIIINENGGHEFYRVQRVEGRWLEGGKERGK